MRACRVGNTKDIEGYKVLGIGKRATYILVNAITVMRVVGACVLLVVEPLSVPFFMLYVACGASDVADGWLARHFGVTSAFGAQLDSVADTAFVCALLVSLLPGAGLPWWLWLAIGLVAGIKITALGVGFARFHAYASLHTYANKATGVVLFALPVLFLVVGSVAAAVLVCIIALLAAVEELVLLATASTLNRDERGILGKFFLG